MRDLNGSPPFVYYIRYTRNKHSRNAIFVIQVDLGMKEEGGMVVLLLKMGLLCLFLTPCNLEDLRSLFVEHSLSWQTTD